MRNTMIDRTQTLDRLASYGECDSHTTADSKQFADVVDVPSEGIRPASRRLDHHGMAGRRHVFMKRIGTGN
jgi:hypothetical protein